jgi:hypothetical protein
MISNRVTPENITTLNNNEIFVFPSNLAGRHGAGAAKFSLKLGSIWGKPIGLMGRCYAIPTKDRYIKTLPIIKIKPFVDDFIEWAILNPDNIFLVTAIGCGLAGYTAKDIAPLFKEAVPLENIHLPQSFWNVLITKNILKILSEELEPYKTVADELCIDGVLTSEEKINEFIKNI